MNPLPMFIRFHVIDTWPFIALRSSMRWMVLLALAVGFSALPVRGQDDDPSAPPKLVKTPTSAPRAKAEPENPNAYGPPIPPDREGPSEADIGPVLKHFVRASTLDNLGQTQIGDNASLITHEKIAIDKRITIPVIHDVQNDGINSPGTNNHALDYETTEYFNWGAVTQEQQMARRGHYFTITWANHGAKDDFTARFQYRQVRSKEVIRSLKQPMPHVHGAVRSYFAVVDQAYFAYGPVVSWRFTILKGDTVVAETKSFIW
jgi:hypothetical protein